MSLDQCWTGMISFARSAIVGQKNNCNSCRGGFRIFFATQIQFAPGSDHLPITGPIIIGDLETGVLVESDLPLKT